MSLSLSAVQADGYYQPPDFDHKRHGTINKVHGTHRLGVRAKKIHEGIIVVRFEMPFKSWCLSCGTLIAKGVRFDAEKSKIGQFHSSAIWQFSMKCHQCSGIYIIKTDPDTAQYICVSGIRRKEENYDPKAAEGHNFRSEEELLASERDPLLKLEILKDDSQKIQSESSRLEQLLAISSARADDVQLNKMLRKRRRTDAAAELARERKPLRLSREEELEIERETSAAFAGRKRKRGSLAVEKQLAVGVLASSASPTGSGLVAGSFSSCGDVCKKSDRRYQQELLLRAQLSRRFAKRTRM